MKKSVRILVVEDENIVAKDIQTRLEALEYPAPRIASTGEDALRIAEEMRPDLILMDIMLARGQLDGVDVALALKHRIEAPVVFLTAYADANTLARVQVTEPYGYILKPFETRDLHITIEMVLAKHRMELELRESKKLLSTTLSTMKEAVITADPSGRIAFMNEASRPLTGWNLDDAQGKSLASVFAAVREDSRHQNLDMLQELNQLNETSLSVSDLILKSKDGTERPIDCTVSKIQLNGGAPLGFVLVFRDITERKNSEEAIRYLAYHDILTGLPNRTLLFERMNQAMVQTKRHHREMAFLFLDLDDFKRINDTRGHAAGDALLKELAERLVACVREDDMVVRLAGDEFIVVLNDIASVEDINNVARKILHVLREPFSFSLYVTVSIGVSVYPVDGDNIEALIRSADAAMYEAKSKGKNNYVIRSEMSKARTGSHE